MFNKQKTALVVIGLVVATIAFGYSVLMFWSFVKGYTLTATQIAHNHADEIRNIPELRTNIQPWAMQLMAKFRDGQIQTNGTYSFFGQCNGITVAPQEMPKFIKTRWSHADNYGFTLPMIVIVMTNNEPYFAAIAWPRCGIIVGSPQYHLSIECTTSESIIPGVYAYAFEDSP